MLSGLNYLKHFFYRTTIWNIEQKSTWQISKLYYFYTQFYNSHISFLCFDLSASHSSSFFGWRMGLSPNYNCIKRGVEIQEQSAESISTPVSNFLLWMWIALITSLISFLVVKKIRSLHYQHIELNSLK